MNRLILVGFVANHTSLYIALLFELSLHFKRITFLTNDVTFKRLSSVLDTNIVNVVMNKGRNDKIIKKHLKLINCHDILIMDEYYGIYYKLRPFKLNSKKKILIIHNSNKWLQTKLVYNFKYLYTHFIKNIFFNQFDAYITMGPNIKEYFRTLKNDSPVFFFPFDKPLKDIVLENDISKKETIDIVIPGMISEERRNYKDILNVLEKYYNKYPKSKIRIIFLGKIAGEDEKFIIQISDKINEMFGKRITYWNKFIPPLEFEQQLINADIILSNVKIINNYKDRIEIYGITKEAGVSFIIYKYEKPAIVSGFQNILSNFNSQLIKYNKYSDLISIFSQLEKGEINLLKLKQKAKMNKQKFNKLIIAENSKIIKFLKTS